MGGGRGSEAEKILDLDASSTDGPHIFNIILIRCCLLWVRATLNLHRLLPKQSRFPTYPPNYDTYLQVLTGFDSMYQNFKGCTKPFKASELSPHQCQRQITSRGVKNTPQHECEDDRGTLLNAFSWRGQPADHPL